MASTTTQTHFRSISLPSRLPSTNPINFEKINSKSVAINSEAIQSGLLELAQLYNSVQGFVQSPTNQKSQIHQDGLMELIDSCNTIRELFQIIRESVQSLQSAIRRKGRDSTIQNDVASYLCSRKKMNKCISKSLKTLKNLESNCISVNTQQNDLVITEATQVSIAIFRSILTFLSCTIAKSCCWNVISNLMLNKSGKNTGGVMSEVECADFAMNRLQCSIKSPSKKIFDGEMVQRSLQNLDSCILGFETGLEKLFRQLIQCRVAYLNILTDH